MSEAEIWALLGGQNWGPQYKQIRWMLPDMSHTPGSLWLKTNVKTITCKRPFNGGNRAEYFSLQCAEVFCDTLISERHACRNLEVTFNDLQVCSQWKRMKKLDSWICAQLASVSRSTDYVQPCHCLPPRTPISMLFKKAWQPTKSILSAAT